MAKNDNNKVGNDKNQPLGNNRNNYGRKIPIAMFAWLIALLGIGIFMLREMRNNGPVVEWTQSQFEQKLSEGAIREANITPESEREMTITGSFDQPKEPQQILLDGEAPKKGDTDKQAGVEARDSVGKYKTRVLASEYLTGLLTKTNCKVIPRSTFWDMVGSFLPVLIILIIIYILFARQMKMAGKGAMQFGKSRARFILPDELNVKFDDIAGADEAKEEVKELVDFLRDPIKFKLVGGNIPRGCLLTGNPGTGKTLLAKAVACEAKVPFFSISGSDFVEMFVGVGASRVRDMFEQARKNMPCVIFIDEIDAVGRSRFSGMGGGHDEREQTLNAMLVEMDGLESRTGVIVLAATNRPDVLDPALLRPGRFDRQIVLDLPDIAGRRKILDIHAAKIKTDSSVNLDVVAKGTPGLSGADLANICNEAALLAARNNREAVIQADMEEAMDKVRYGRERRSRKITEKERRLTAWHEAGHTIVGLNCKNSSPIHKVTIIPRGQAYLGATFTLPEDDTYTRSRNELLDMMAFAMGGRSAEELVFDDITTGAAGDIEHVSSIARSMVCRFGMNEKIGPLKYVDSMANLGRGEEGADRVSEETAALIDAEVRRLAADAHQKALEILREHRQELDWLALALLERETLSHDEIMDLFKARREELENPKSPAENDNAEHGVPEKTADSAANPPVVVADCSVEEIPPVLSENNVVEPAEADSASRPE